jgi:hypothetical protein
MGLPVEVNNLMMGSLGGYTIGRSLRFRSSASAYLSRTPASNGNRQIWTFSCWLKLGALSGGQHILSAYNGSTTPFSFIAYNVPDSTGSSNCIQVATSGGVSNGMYTVPIFRDPSAWYHLVVAMDTTQATASNRTKVYINSVLQSLVTGNYPTLNQNTTINSTVAHNIGRFTGGSNYFDGYLGEVNLIDGQQLTPSSFGAYDTNGVWQPKKYTGTYGTNGFYLPFSNTTSTTTLVQDSSGNGNNWTPNNISLTAGTTYDSMIDSPTVSASASNYATGNPLLSSNSVTFSNANLTVSCGGGAGVYRTGGATFGVSSKKWYWEFLFDNTGGSCYGGVGDITQSKSTWESDTTINTNFWFVSAFNGNKINGNGGGVSYGSSFTTSDICMVALDCDNGKLWWGKNGTWFASGDPASGTNAAYTNLSGKTLTAAFQGGSGAGYTNQYSMNFGQRPFSYTPPTGFNALNTYNLPAPSIANGAQYMAATTYTGNGTAGRVITVPNINEVGFAWVKSRSGIDDHRLANIVTGGNKHLKSNTTDAESTGTNIIQAFSSNTFTVGNDTSVNANGSTYVGWTWAANGTGVSNNSGTITSTVSANTTAGFSVVTYTGTGTTATIGHGLGVTPSMIIVKTRNRAISWLVYHTSLGANQYLILNVTNAAGTSAGYWGTPDSSTFGVAGGTAINTASDTYVAYCFSAVSGYSAFGKYTGNGSTDGPFIYTGFRPRWIMVKRTDTTGGWKLSDSSRSPYNLMLLNLNAQNADAEYSNFFNSDFLSNGIKIRTTDIDWNASGGTFVYAVFAENPFNYSRAR